MWYFILIYLLGYYICAKLGRQSLGNDLIIWLLALFSWVGILSWIIVLNTKIRLPKSWKDFF